MKTKSISFATAIAILLALSLPLLGAIENVSAQNENVVLRLSPDVIVGPPPDLGETFTLELQIQDVTNLWSWKVGLSWDATVLHLVDVDDGGFLPDPLIAKSSTPDNVNGILSEVYGVNDNPDGGSGSGVLAYFDFEVVGFGDDIAINIDAPVLAKFDETNPDGEAISIVSVTGATFTLGAPPAHGPTAKFTPADGTWYTVGDSIALDASSSTPGYDTLPVAEICPITDYSWELTGAITMSFSGETASIPASAVGDVTVTLTVTAPDPTPSESGPGFTETGALTKTLHIQAVPEGADIDVYTERGGQGPDAASDAYGPQELIVFYAEVTYNGAAVVNKDVAFEIQDETGHVWAYRTGVTDSNGIASAEYRLPWPDVDPTSVFGEWSIVATVDVSQQVETDTVTFEFNYIIDVISVQTLTNAGVPAVSFARGEMVKVNMTLSNIRNVDVDVTYTVTIYDEAQVPIAAWSADSSVDANDADWFAETLAIPTYAFVGQATVYINVLTTLPSLGGVPYCPEASINFAITA
jgi:hypothetical protein